MRSDFARFVLVSLLWAATTAASAAAQPGPTTSEYLVTTGASFLMTPERGLYYGMDYALLKPLERPLHVVAVFQNPADAASPLRREFTVAAGAKDFMAESDPFRVVTNGKRYAVALLLYAGAGHTELLGKHRQEVSSAILAQARAQLEREYRIRIR